MTKLERARPRPKAGKPRVATGSRSPAAETEASKAQGLQRRLGNQGMQRALGLGAASTKGERVSKPGEADEREAADLARHARPARSASKNSIVDHSEMAWGTRGKPLDPGTRNTLQAQFGTDLSAVRVHTDSGANAQADALEADAATRGNHIAFGAGQYRPDTQAGAELLRHEVAHVVQSARPGAQAKIYRAPKQKDTAIQGLKAVYFTHMRDMLLSTPNVSADTVALVSSLDLTLTTPQTVKTVTVGGKTLTFRLLLSFNRSEGARTQLANDASTPPDTRDYAISVGYDFTSHINQLPKDDPYFTVKKPGLTGEAQFQYQRAWPMAEILHHELQHLQILIDRDIALLDPNASFSEAFKEYVVTRNYLQEIAKSPFGAADKSVANALKAIPTLVDKMCRDIPAPNTPSDAAIATLSRTAIGFFVQEKYAFWKTAAAFSTAPDNALIAHSYAANHFASVLGGLPGGVAIYNNLSTTRVRPNGFFGDLASELEMHVAKLYAYLDSQLLHVGGSHPS